ncbi:hypothetical protein BK749_14240 [Bacillus thuringiensis serovar vazensis]|uniref:Uncharacterized protein n=1 Tax=Bacillus thuringiensis serovar vazensis TaxID=180867 RepID=A0A243CVR1_BACTU|nr:hypothetical protein BK749_14240 [Bacillus thuringiensis serovar vazensis]
MRIFYLIFLQLYNIELPPLSLRLEVKIGVVQYSSEGFKGYIQASTVWDMGDHFATVYSGTVIRC